MYSLKDLERDIRALGVEPHDTLTVHTSLKAIGEIDTSEKTGAEVVIDALKNCVSEGLLLVPSHTYANIREVPVFDIRNTMPCIGTLPGVAVQLANKAYDSGDKTCIRSMQLSHSVVAFGKDAYDFVACDRETITRTPMAGCYGGLYKRGGKILLLGVGLNKNTFIHMVNEYLDYDIGGRAHDNTGYFTAIDYNGNRHQQKRLGTYDEGSATFVRYENALENAGAITYGKVGDADCMLIDARKCFDVVSKTR